MVTVVSNYCQLSQTQLSQTFAEKFTVTEELLQSLKKTALSGDEESIELLHNIALGYDEFGKKAEDILYHIVRNPTNETLSIIRGGGGGDAANLLLGVVYIGVSFEVFWGGGGVRLLFLPGCPSCSATGVCVGTAKAPPEHQARGISLSLP